MSDAPLSQQLHVAVSSIFKVLKTAALDVKQIGMLNDRTVELATVLEVAASDAAREVCKKVQDRIENAFDAIERDLVRYQTSFSDKLIETNKDLDTSITDLQSLQTSVDELNSRLGSFENSLNKLRSDLGRKADKGSRKSHDI